MEQGITQAANDEQQAAPMLEELKALPKYPGRVKTPTANTEYAIENSVNTCQQAKSRLLIALVRQTHNPSPHERLAEPAPLHGQSAALEAIAAEVFSRENHVCWHHNRLASPI